MPRAWKIEWCRATPTRFAVLGLLALPAAAHARAPITPVPVAPGQTRIEVVYHDPKSTLAKAVFQCGPDSSMLPVYVNLLRRRGEERLTRLLGQLDLPVREAGVTVPRTDRQPDVFYRAEADSGDRQIREIGLVVPWSFEFMRLRVTRHARGERAPERHVSANFNNAELRDERAFLLALEQEGLATPGSGFVAPPPAPAAAQASPSGDAGPLDLPALFGAWMADNDSITAGRMRVQRLTGMPPAIGDVTDSLTLGTLTITAHFQSGVLASNRPQGESWALFHPHAKQAWPTALAASGRWLVIGTHGEGLACVDPGTLDLRRLPLAAPFDQVVTIEARGDTVIINGLRRVALPSR